MRVFYHSNQKSFFDPINEETSFTLKIICDDGVIFCDRLIFILWSKKWREILDPDEEISVLIFPGIEKRSMELVLKLLKEGDIIGMESEFENFFDLALDIIHLPGGFTNFETSNKLFEVKATNIKNKRAKFKTLRDFTCEFCLSVFINKQAKDRHVENIHQPKELYNCSLCNMSFKSKVGLNTHEKIKHSTIQDHNCNICNAKFTNETNLKRHIQSTHQDEFTCDNCKKVFNSKRELENHQKDNYNCTHASVKSKLEKRVFACEDCDFTTFRSDSLLRHRRLKHQLFRKDFPAIKDTLKETQNWTCSKCNQTFTTSIEIGEHVRICKEIKCHICNKKFTLRSNLKQHLEKRHSVCKKCNKRFKTNRNLKIHQNNCLNNNG